MDEPIGATGTVKAKKDEKRKDTSKLSKKQKKVVTFCVCEFCFYCMSPNLQHLKEEKKLERDLCEASAVESKEKKAKIVSV